jgi:hypothetical protein
VNVYVKAAFKFKSYVYVHDHSNSKLQAEEGSNPGGCWLVRVRGLVVCELGSIPTVK